jgi:hypothetical protein
MPVAASTRSKHQNPGTERSDQEGSPDPALPALPRPRFFDDLAVNILLRLGSGRFVRDLKRSSTPSRTGGR